MPDKRRRLATPWPEALNASIVVFISIDVADEGAVSDIDKCSGMIELVVAEDGRIRILGMNRKAWTNELVSQCLARQS
jgi:hypothetical protein